MIKFFRKIRQKLLSENKPASPVGRFSKYLLYAIGEITLVVIGILIALGINNWNETRKDRIQETILLKSLQRDLKSDIKNINMRLDSKRLMLKGFANCLDILAGKKEGSKKEFMKSYERIMQVNAVSLNATTFNNLQNNGELKLIKNKILTDSIVAYYNSDLNGWQTSLRDYSRNNFAPYILNYDFLPEVEFDFLNLDNELRGYYEGLPANDEFLVSDKSLEEYKTNFFIINMLKFKSRNVIGLMREYKKLSDYAKNLGRSIQNEINNNR